MSTTVQYMDVHDQVIYTPYGWCAFPQLDHFNTDLLLEVLLSKDGNGQPAVWKTAEIPVTENGSYCLSTVALMQLEALFNLSQVMFALYNGNIKQATFRDIQLRHASRDIRTAGFRKLGSGGSNMREALHSVAWDIVEAGALPVIFSMYKNPVLPIVKQKTLDTLTNVLNVEKISKHILREDGWFLRETVSLINGGDLSSEKTPAASCISRMIAAILCLRLKKEFNILVELKYADVVLSVLEDKTLSEDRTKEFCKFETITLQSISMLLQDGQYVSCNQEISNRLYSYAYECIMQWQIEDSQPGLTIDSSEGNTDAGFATGGLVFSLIILVHITKSRMEKKHLLASDTKFEHQLLFLWDAYGPQSSLGRINTGVMNAIADLHSGLFDQAFLSDKKNSGLALPSLSILRNKVKRHCSNHQCQKVETKVQEFKVCSGCHLVCYCSVACQRSDWKRGGHKRNCKLLKIGVRQPRNDRMTENIEKESQDVKQLSTVSDEQEITAKMSGKCRKDIKSLVDDSRNQVRSPLKDLNTKQTQPASMPSVMTQSIPRTDENIGRDRQAIQTEENTLSDSHTSEQSPLDSSLNESLPEKVESDRLDDKMTCVNSDAPSSPNASVTEVLDSVDSIAADPTIAPPVSLVMPQQSNTSVSSQSYGVASHPPLFGEHVIQISQFKKNMGIDKLHDKHDTDYDADNEATPPVQTKVQNLSPIPESEESSELGSSFCDNSPSTATEELKCENSTSQDESNVSVDWSIETQCGSEVPSISQSISSINQTSLSDGVLADDEEDEEVVIFDIRKRKEYMEEIAKEEAGEQAQESSCESSYTADAGDQDSSINDEESSIDGYSTNELSALFKLIRDVTNVSVDDGSGSDDNSDGIETTEGSEAVYKYDHLEENCENATPLVGVEGSEGGIDGPLDQLIKLIETLFPQCADQDITVDSSYRSDDENVEEIQLHKDTFTADTENKDCTETRLISDSDNNIQSLKFCDQELCNHAAFNLPGPDEFQTSSEFWEINAEKLLFTARQDIDSDLDSSRSPQGFLAPQEGEKLDDSDDAQIKLLEFEQVPDSLQNKAETDIHCDSRDSKEDDASEGECKTEGDLCQETDQFHLEDLESRFLDDNDEETSSEWSLDISYNLEDGISNSSSDPEDYIIMLQSDLPNEDSDDQFQLALDSFSFTETSDSDEYSDMEEYFTEDRTEDAEMEPPRDQGDKDMAEDTGIFSECKISMSDNSMDRSDTVKEEDTSCDKSRLSSESDTLEGDTIDAVMSARSETVSENNDAALDSETDEFYSPMRDGHFQVKENTAIDMSLPKRSTSSDVEEQIKEVTPAGDSGGSRTCNVM